MNISDVIWLQYQFSKSLVLHGRRVFIFVYSWYFSVTLICPAYIETPTQRVDTLYKQNVNRKVHIGKFQVMLMQMFASTTTVYREFFACV